MKYRKHKSHTAFSKTKNTLHHFWIPNPPLGISIQCLRLQHSHQAPNLHIMLRYTVSIKTQPYTRHCCSILTWSSSCYGTWSINTGWTVGLAWQCNWYVLILLVAPTTLALWPMITTLWSSLISTMENTWWLCFGNYRDIERSRERIAVTFRVEGRK